MGSSHQNGQSGGHPPPKGEPAPPGCPSDAQLELLLEADEGSPEHRRFVVHLENCPLCPGRLDALWSRSADGNRTPVPGQLDRDQFNRILDRISAKTTASQFDLSFLPLSLRTGCLGQLGPYDLERVIGSGGMGLVFQARDFRTGERVAVKTLRRPREAGADLRERFLREGRIAQPIRHPGVLPVQDSGTDSGIPYLVTPLLTGRSFDSLIRDKAPLPVGEAVEWVRQAAEALGAAHRLNIVHRDIKPSNLWLRGEGEAGRVCVIDFGLALGETRGDLVRLTTVGTMLGTPAYIAPEQAAGERAGPPADVFSLGCVLYEMVTGRRVFPGDNPLEVLRAIAAFRVVPAERFRPDLPRPLRDILARCLELDPADRFPDALALAEDLRRLQAGMKSLYRPLGWPEQVRRWVARHPGLATTFGLAALALTTATAVSIHQANEAGKARAVAEAEVEISRATAERNRQLLYFAGVRSAVNSYLTGRVGEALSTLTHLEDDPEYRPLLGFEWHQLASLCRESVVEMPLETQGTFLPILGFAEISPGTLTAFNKESFLRIDWRKKSSTLFPADCARNIPVSLTLSPDGKRGAWVTPDGQVKLIDLLTGNTTTVCSELEAGKARISHLALGPTATENLFLVLKDPEGGKHRLLAWDLRAGKISHSQELDNPPDRQFLSSPDGTALLAMLKDRRLAVWRPGQADGLVASRPIPLESASLLWRRDGKNCYAMGREKFQTRVYFWDLTGEPAPVDFGSAQPNQMAPATNGAFFVFDNAGALHQVEGNRARPVPGHIAPGLYHRLLMGDDPRFPLLGISRRGTATRSTVVPPAPAERYTLPKEGRSLAIDLYWLDDSHLVARQARNEEGFSHLTLLRHQAEAGGGPAKLTPIRTVRHSGRLMVASSGQAGRLLVVRETGCTWLDTEGETETGVKLEKMPFQLAPAGDGFAGLDRDGTLFLLDGTLRRQWSLGVPGSEKGAGEMLGFAIAPDGSSLVVLWRNQDMTTSSWVRTADGANLSTETRQDLSGVVDIAMVSPENLAIARATGDVFLHNLPERRTVGAGESMDRIPQYLAYSRAANRLASIDIGGQVDLWDTRHWLRIPIISDPENNRSNIPLRLIFAPGGGKLAYLDEEGTVSVLSAIRPGRPGY